MKILLISLLLSVSGSPGTVTHWEFKHAQIGWSRYHVQKFYETRGELVGIWYGEAGHMHVDRRYPTEDGGTTTAIYRDTKSTTDGTQQGRMLLTDKTW